MNTSLLSTGSPPGIRVRVIAGAATAAVAVPAASWGTDERVAALITSVAAIAIGVTLAILVARHVPRPALAWLGALLVAVSALLVAVTPRGVITITFGALAGVGAGLVTPRSRPLSDRWAVAGLAAALGLGALALAAVGASAALWWATVVTVVAAISNMAVNQRQRSAASGATVGVGVVAATWAILTMSWVAANTPTVNWFGGTVSHGPRGTNEVAITFDDGPTIRSRSRCATSSTPTA